MTDNKLINLVNISKLPANQSPLNTVFQKYALFNHMTISDNIAFIL